MTKRRPFPGTCTFCGGTFPRARMTAHLKSCKDRESGRGRVARLFIESRHYADFWLHIEATPATKLATIDELLRDTWLDCCGHLSRFTIGGQEYWSRVFEDGWGPPPAGHVGDPPECPRPEAHVHL